MHNAVHPGATKVSYSGCVVAFLVFAVLLTSARAQTQASAEGPTDEKARKTYQHALELAKKHELQFAFDDFRKADKQDDGRCIDCKKKIIKYGIELHEWKTAAAAATELAARAQGAKEVALAHYQCGLVYMYQGLDKKKDEFFSNAHEEFGKALTAVANFPDAVFADGQALARLEQDDAAKARFEQFAKMPGAQEVDRQRALRFISQPELARAKMAPAFSVTTADGKHVSLDELHGRVVLLDFWATWCAPCRQALPHMRDVAKKFQGEPLIVLSVSLDDDENAWKDFVTKNEMTWMQYRDGGFTGPIAQLFNVRAIPQTFTIDADGVLQDQHIGDAAIEGKLKKLIARANEVQAAQKSTP